MRTAQMDTQEQIATMIPTRYRILLYLSIFLVVVDLAINTFSEFIAPNRFGQLIVFILQDVCIVFSVTLLIVMVLTTYVAQAGLLCLLLRLFRFPIIMALIYLCFCAILQGLLLGDRFSRESFIVSAFAKNEVLAFYVIQRSMSVLYYYGMKRASYRLSDPHFYQSSKWLQSLWEQRRSMITKSSVKTNSNYQSAGINNCCACCSIQ